MSALDVLERPPGAAARPDGHAAEAAVGPTRGSRQDARDRRAARTPHGRGPAGALEGASGAGGAEDFDSHDAPMSRRDAEEAMMAAARKGDVEGLDGGLGVLGVPVDFQDRRGRSALHHAAREGGVAVARLLTARGANIHLTDRCGATALHEASLAGQLGVVRHLLEAGADPNCRKKNGCTPLHEASWFGHDDIVRQLLAAGSDPIALNYNEESPIGLAEKHLNDSVVAILEDYLKFLDEQRYETEERRRKKIWHGVRAEATDRERHCGHTIKSPRRERLPNDWWTKDAPIEKPAPWKPRAASRSPSPTSRAASRMATPVRR